MFDVITFGSATWDIFILYDNSVIAKGKDFVSKKDFCLPLGAKIDVKDFIFKIGGGGTNTAVAFAKQGFKVAYCGAIGQSLMFKEDYIIDQLKFFGVVPFIFRKGEKNTNSSIIFGNPQKDRTILVYRGASELLTVKDIPWSKLKTKWLYLAPLSGKASFLFKELIEFIERNKIKVAVNLGNSQIFLPSKILYPLLEKIEILILNQEEACLLVNVPCYNINIVTEKRIFQKLRNLNKGIIIITKGEQGVSVVDQNYFYQAEALKIPRRKIIDLTGAGDAFGSGFVSSFIRNGDVVKSIQLGLANSCSCIQAWGAKDGLLNKDDHYQKVKVKKVLFK